MIFVFLIWPGLTGAATVVPTSGLVGKLFGLENLATLFGIMFAGHQIGGFFSAWMGGRWVEAGAGYVLIWSVGDVLSLFAMAVSFCIAEPNGHSGSTRQPDT